MVFTMKDTIKILIILIMSLVPLTGLCQVPTPDKDAVETEEVEIDPASIYDQIIKDNVSQMSAKAPENIEPQKDQLALLLPKLDGILYQGWSKEGNTNLWLENDAKSFIPFDKQLLNDLEIEKAIRQSYKSEEQRVDISIYKFKNFTSAYSIFTLLHKGKPSKLKVGRMVSESENAISFWKGSYYVELIAYGENLRDSKGFAIISSQEISRNINSEDLPPAVAIQLPSLNRIAGSEKYCINPKCCKEYFPAAVLELDPSIYNLSESHGAITAEYAVKDIKEKKKNKKPDKNKEEEVIKNAKLLFIRYKDPDISQKVFKSLSNYYEKKAEAKEVKINTDDGHLEIKKDKDNFLLIKQKGILLAIVFDLENEEEGNKILNLVPWPIDLATYLGN